MRMRKLPWAEDYLEEQEIVIKRPEDIKGRWNNHLDAEIIHLEIGSGKGDYWVKMGQLYPNIGWIGVEKNRNVAALAVRKYVQADISSDHAAFIAEDAEALETWFADGEIDVIHLNFSDPWPKKRAHKKRLSNVKFIEQYKRILKHEGEIQMKTDNKDLFEYSILQFQNTDWYLHEFYVDFRRTSHPEDVISEYENRFIGLGQPIYRAVWKRQKPQE